MNAEYFIIGFIVLLASFVQGFSGFGFALVSIPLLTYFIGIKTAIPLGALCGLLINFLLYIKLKDHINFKEIIKLLIGAAAGIPFGVFFLSTADPAIIKIILGIIIILFVFLSVFSFIPQRKMNLKWGYVFGLFSGLLGGALNTNGPPVLIYFFLQGWDKIKQKASITGFFIISSLLIVGSHIATGITGSKLLLNFVYLIPFIIVGFAAGNFLFSKISTVFFNRFILLFLFVVGIFLLLGI